MIKNLLMGFLLAAAICGCSSLRPAPPPAAATAPAAAEKLEIRNNAASLLLDLLKDEQDVDKVLVVKSASPDVTALIKLIAATAHAQRLELEEMVTNDSTLNLKVTGLPPGEVAARKATTESEEHDLLFSSGANFEFNLLYSQAEAENYGWHLAAVAAKNSGQTNETRVFETISKGMEGLDQQVVSALRHVPAN